MPPRSRPPSASAASPRAAALLDVLAGIVALLAQTSAAAEEVPRVLELLCATLDADECALWMDGPHGLVRAGRAFRAGRGAPPEPSAIGAAMLDGVQSARMIADGRDVGVLGVRSARRLDGAERRLLECVAGVLGPTLAHAEHSRRLEVEVALRTRQIDEQRQFMQKIVDSLPVGLYVIDREYRIQAWNRKRETGLQGVSREEAIGRTIFEILHRQPAEVMRTEFDDVFRTGSIQQFQMESRASGEMRTYRITKIPMRLDEGPVSHVITIGEDVTEWRGALERISQAEKLAAIGTLAAGVMHEINNPMATIAACAETLQLRFDENATAGIAIPPEAGSYLRLIDNEVHRCKRIIDGLLDFSRPRGAVRERVDVNDVIERTLFLLSHHARFKMLQVTTQLDRAGARPVLGNPEQLVQVFMALLINAMDSMHDRGTVTIRTRGDAIEGTMVAEVVDEGQGIARSELPKIFEPFYTTKPPGRGTGLGLSICYGIVADHGGRLEVDSDPGHGATFRITLPGVVA